MTESMKNEPKKQNAAKRAQNFEEVSLGFTKEQAIAEAQRCLQCKNPLCVPGCPVNVQIPQFIQLIKDGKPEQAAKKIKQTNNLPAVCGRVCPQENQCEGECILNKMGKEPVNIGALERYAADSLKTGDCDIAETGIMKQKVAVIGGGPSGLSCAADLGKLGYQVTLFEAFHKAGGVLVYGIPEFRLPKGIVEEEIRCIEDLGVKFELNFVAGATATVQDLFDEGFEAAYLSVGAGTPRFLNIPGENIGGVFSANEYLTRVNLMKAYDFPLQATPVKQGCRVVVVGGGNVAMDAARTALRLIKEKKDCNVKVIYRRSREEMPAREDEIENAIEEGVQIEFLTSPLEIIAGEKGTVAKIKCNKMKLGEPDDSGRRRPEIIEGSEIELDADIVIVAVGALSNPLLTKKTKGLKLNQRGYIEVDEAGMTSISGVFAGGDIVTGAATVIKAMGAGKKAAKNIAVWLQSKGL